MARKLALGAALAAAALLVVRYLRGFGDGIDRHEALHETAPAQEAAE